MVRKNRKRCRNRNRKRNQLKYFFHKVFLQYKKAVEEIEMAAAGAMPATSDPTAQTPREMKEADVLQLLGAPKVVVQNEDEVEILSDLVMEHGHLDAEVKVVCKDAEKKEKMKSRIRILKSDHQN